MPRTLLLFAALAFGCAAEADQDAPAIDTATDPQLVFWASLESLCGLSFEGRIAENQPPDDSFAGRALVMQVRECLGGEVRIPFHVGDDRSRTWVVTTTAAGLRLKHDHRHEDGTEDEVTQYGGDTQEIGTATVQEFPADALTAELVPAAANNVWAIEVVPGKSFAYALRREGSDRRFRVEFDLQHPIDAPPPPWGG